MASLVAANGTSPLDRKWVLLGDGGETNKSFRVVSYNILADGERLALSDKHKYCPMNLRVWTYRWGKLKEELAHYAAGVVALQEVLPTAFRENIEPFFTELGYCPIYFKDKTKANEKSSHRGMSVATFIDRSKFAVIASEGVYYNSMLTSGIQTGRFKKKLLGLREGILLTLVRHLVTDKMVLVANTHIHWDPSYPHVKAQQCAFACDASKAFLQKHAGSSDEPVPLVMVGDFNTLPFFQEEFVPSVQKAWWSTKDLAVIKHGLPSGAYQLLSRGSLKQDHPEHPDSFAKSSRPKIKTEEELQLEAAMSAKELKKKRAKEHPAVGELKTGFTNSSIGLTDVYSFLIQEQVPFTTKVDVWEGAIDYIWGNLLEENSRLKADGYLELPYQWEGKRSASGAWKYTKKTFPPIPNVSFSSDHLAIGAIFSF